MDTSPKLPDSCRCKTKDISNSRLWECLVDYSDSCPYLRVSDHNFICGFPDPSIFENVYVCEEI